jgi:hypothetical protein
MLKSAGSLAIRIAELTAKMDAIVTGTTDPEEQEFMIYQLAGDIAGNTNADFGRVHAVLLQIQEVKSATDISDTKKGFEVYKLFKEIVV